MLKKHCFGGKGFLICMIFPIGTPAYYIYMVSKMNRKYPIMATPVKSRLRNAVIQLFEQPFREHVFCWDAWRLFQRLIIALFAVFLTNPLLRLGCIVLVTLFLLIVHLKVTPNKDHLVNFLETASLSSLCILVTVNLFRSFLYVYNVNNDDAISKFWRIYVVLESILHPLIFLLIYCIYKLVSVPTNKFIRKLTIRKTKYK